MRSLIFVVFACFICLSATAASPHSKKVAELLLKLDNAYSSHNDSLVYFLNQAEGIVQKEKDYAALVDIYRIRGTYKFISGDHSGALESYIAGIKIGEQYKVTYELEKTYYEVAGVYSKNKNNAISRQYINKGFEIGQQIRDTIGIADGHNRMGIMLEREGKIDSALWHYQMSLQLNESVRNTRAMSYSMENVATIYAQQKKYDEAISYLKKSLAIRTDHNDKYGIAMATINISEVFKEAGKTDSAISYALLAEKAGTAVNFNDLIQYTYEHLCMLYKSKNDFKEALHYHELFTQMKDSVYNTEKSKQIAEFSTKFDTERKEQEIKVLNKQRTIQRLGLFISILLLLVMVVVAWVIYKSRRLKEQKLQAEAEFHLQLQKVEAKNALQHERLRISRELHDNIGAHLTFINATVDNMDKDAGKVQQVKDLTNDTIRELRKTVWLINKSSVKMDEFVVKLRDFFKNIQHLSIAAEVDDPNAVLNAEQITELFRATQESINNALKYSGAKNIMISIQSSAKDISILITDNGCGFDLSNEANKGFGLENMKHRMGSIGGSYELCSEPGKGTSVSLKAHFDVNTMNIV